MRKISLFILTLFVWVNCATAKTEQPLRLLYWNIQNGMWDGQTDDYQRFTDWVRQQAPDICVWCESRKNYKTNSGEQERESISECKSRWKRLAERYGHKYVYLSAVRDNFPQMITSKYPVETTKLIYGNGKDSIVAHGAGWFQMKVGKKNINIVTLHTWPMGFKFGISSQERAASTANKEGDKYRRMEMEYICKATILQDKKCKKNLWMMMGDFNAISPVDNSQYNLEKNAPEFLTHSYILENTPYQDVIKEKHPNTFLYSVGSKQKRIDFVYLTPRLLDKVKDANIIEDSYTTAVRNPQKISNFWHPSDHLPIIVNFDLNK